MSITETIAQFGQFLAEIAKYVKELYETVMKLMNKE